MKPHVLLLTPLLWVGCASSPTPFARDPALPANAAAQDQAQTTKTPNWEEIDKTSQRVREREKKKAEFVETSRTVEQGFLPMSGADYTAALDAARADVRKANPKWTDSDVETEAIKRADQAKWRAEHSYSTRASSTYELRKP
jgi:hypothetical protein